MRLVKKRVGFDEWARAIKLRVQRARIKAHMLANAEQSLLYWDIGHDIIESQNVEGWGGGVARYFSGWTAVGLPCPKLEETSGFFKVIFERKKRAKSREPLNKPVNKPLNKPLNEPVNEPLNKPVNEPVKMAVVQAIRKTPGIGHPALVRIVGKSRATMTRVLSNLVAQGIIEHRGSDKTGGYFPIAPAHTEVK